MKRTMFLLLIFLTMEIFIISGCSDRPRSRGDFPAEGRGFGRMGNMSETERQQIFEERQQVAIEACEEKSDGENCRLESPRGDMEGSCESTEGGLACMPESPMVRRE